MSQLFLGFQALYMHSHRCECVRAGCRLQDGHAQCTGNTSREPDTIRGTARRPHFSLAIISVTVRIQVFLVRSVYFNLKNILPKSGTFLPGNPVYEIAITVECGILLDFMLQEVVKLFVKRSNLKGKVLCTFP